MSQWVCWTWPCAARAAYELQDADETSALLAALDTYRPGELSPILHAERSLVFARLAADERREAADDLFATAIESLRRRSTPYHLAHGLIDDAER